MGTSRQLDSGDASQIGVRKRRTSDRALSLGAVYTPSLLSDWAADLLAEAIPKGAPGVVLDPACGAGALLLAASKKTARPVVGVDCDETALKACAAALPRAKLRNGDGLMYLADVAQKKIKEGIAGVIANPPWGAALQSRPNELRKSGYLLASGQFDSWDLFVEGIVRALPSGSAAVLILPDALFLPEHKKVRKLLASETTILRVARLGEGLFPGVYRGTVVVSFRNIAPTGREKVTCLRLTAAQRRQIMAGDATFADIAETCSHHVPQNRYLKDEDCRFDIDTREDEKKLMRSIERHKFPWDEWFDTGRGVELSKTGRVYRCPVCAEVRPPSRSEAVLYCRACGHRWKPARDSAVTIVSKLGPSRNKGWRPLIVGEDVGRHHCSPSRMVKMGVQGVRYKHEKIFDQPKLLIRKTGLGIKACVDEAGALTNQVVFHFLPKKTAPAGVLDYLEGVLCSRVMLAWHLKRHGDVEWRSHPYVTQQVIKTFPVPVPRGKEGLARVREIGRLVRKMRAFQAVGKESRSLDLLVERRVAEMFGLSSREMGWVLDVLESADALEPIRTLRLPGAHCVFPGESVRSRHARSSS